MLTKGLLYGCSEIKQPLLEGPDRPLLLEGPPVAPSASQVAPQGAGRSPEERLQDEQNARYARGASRVVTYTVWFLLAAVMIGTIVGIIFVTLPMQQGSIPGIPFPLDAQSSLEKPHQSKQEGPVKSGHNTKKSINHPLAVPDHGVTSSHI